MSERAGWRGFLRRELDYAAGAAKGLGRSVVGLAVLTIVGIAVVFVLAIGADWGKARWADLQAWQAKRDQKAAIRQEHDGLMRASCVGERRLSAACVQWAQQ